MINDAPIFRGDGNEFERALHVGWRTGRRRQADHFNIGKLRALDGIMIVSANPEPDVERRFELDPERAAGRPQRPAGSGDGHRNIFSALLQTNPVGRGSVGLDFPCQPALGFPILKRSQSVAMHRNIRIRRIRIQRLADHQAGFAVRISIRADPADVCGQCQIAGHALPYEVKRVIGGPHVFAAARDPVAAAR